MLPVESSVVNVIGLAYVPVIVLPLTSFSRMVSGTDFGVPFVVGVHGAPVESVMTMLATGPNAGNAAVKIAPDELVRYKLDPAEMLNKPAPFCAVNPGVFRSK